MRAAEHDRVSAALLIFNFGERLIDKIDDMARNDARHGAILCHRFAPYQERQAGSAGRALYPIPGIASRGVWRHAQAANDRRQRLPRIPHRS